MPKQEKYDLCIIGGGPAGYAASMRAVDFKKRVVLIEKGKVGGLQFPVTEVELPTLFSFS